MVAITHKGGSWSPCGIQAVIQANLEPIRAARSWKWDWLDIPVEAHLKFAKIFGFVKFY